MKIQLNFETPPYISANVDPEKLVLLLHDFRYNDELIVDDQEIQRDLPNQLDANFAAAVGAAGDTTAAGIGGSMSFNFIANIVMKTSMNQMLTSIKNLQVIVHLLLFTFIVPAIT